MGKNEDLFEVAKMFIPGGVNSPVRAFDAVGGSPRFIKKANGAHLFDEEGNDYIDYVCSWGPLILGHANEIVIEAITDAAKDGTSFGACTEKEIILAKMICDSIPSVETVRLVNSGTEAVMSALRLARAYTKRDHIVKFKGCYHGHADPFLVQAGSGLMTLGTPSSPGVPEETVKKTLLCEYNDIEELENIFKEKGNEIAAVIVEPVAGNMGLITPDQGFLEATRKLTEDFGALLIFDEVITGFRIGLGGAQEFFDITPDLTTLGKIIGGGLPVGAYGGKKEIMSMMAPGGPVYQAGTLSGNPLAVSAGIATLNYLIDKDPYPMLEEKTSNLIGGIGEIISKNKYIVGGRHISSMFYVCFSKDPVWDWEEAKECDTKKYARFFNCMLKNGVYIPPSQFETWFVSTAHTDKDLEKTLIAIEKSLKEVFA